MLSSEFPNMIYESHGNYIFHINIHFYEISNFNLSENSNLVFCYVPNNKHIFSETLLLNMHEWKVINPFFEHDFWVAHILYDPIKLTRSSHFTKWSHHFFKFWRQLIKMSVQTPNSTSPEFRPNYFLSSCE